MENRSQMSIEFFDAIKQGKLDEVQCLLSLSPELIYERADGLSPIIVAAYCQKPEIVDFLSNKTGSLNIFEAAATGKTNQLARHLARDPLLINAYSSDGFQPLGLACFFGHCETAEYLIKAGAVVNSPSQNSLSVTPIQSATAAGHADVVLLLLQHNANPNTRENNGFTPLHVAAQNGNTPIIRSLLYNGADLTIRTHEGKLPLELAIEAGHTDAAMLLKEGITRRFKAFRLTPAKN
jgi:ankyrin repeat protein